MKDTSNSLCVDKICLEAARKQFCLDIGLDYEEYQANREKQVFIRRSVYVPDTLQIASEGARNYAGRNAFFWAIICLGQLFITCDERIYDWVVEQYGNTMPEWFCSYKNLRKLDKKLQEYGHGIYDTHVYFLPEAEQERPESTQMMEEKWVWYSQEEIRRFQEKNRFTSAICFWEGQPDVLAVACMKEQYLLEKQQGKACEVVQEKDTTKDFDQNHMCAMAGASQDGVYLWQIGINVDKEYAGLGLGHGLVRAMKEEIMRCGRVPFYGTSESHTISQTVGLKAGFVPAWTEVSACKIDEKDR